VGISEQLARSQDRLDSFLIASDSVATKLNSGHGTLGRMLNDSSLYVSSEAVMVQLAALLADIQRNPRRYINLRIF
jgi:phospholipid/cholesterol/gamma-HCH transport system substrate-binding protein